MNYSDELFALHLQLFHLPLTICAGYYSRDRASRAEGSVRTITSDHPSGGILYPQLFSQHAGYSGQAAHSCGSGPLHDCGWRKGLKIAKPLAVCVSRCSISRWARVWSARTRRELTQIISMSSANTYWLKIRTDNRVVGTYRMQSGCTAATNLGYYSEQEFDFAPYEPLRRDILELGRASIDREHQHSRSTYIVMARHCAVC